MSTFAEDDGPYPNDDEDNDLLEGHINSRRADIPPESAAYLKNLIWKINGDHATYRPPGKSDEVRKHLGKAGIYFQYPDDTIRIPIAHMHEMLPGWYDVSRAHYQHHGAKALVADAQTRHHEGAGHGWQAALDDGSDYPKAHLLCRNTPDQQGILSLLSEAKIHVFSTPTIDGRPAIIADARALQRAGIIPKRAGSLDLSPAAEREQASQYLRSLGWQAVSLPATETFITLPNERAELTQDYLLAVHCTQFTRHVNDDDTTTLTVNVDGLEKQVGALNITLATHSQRARSAHSAKNQRTSIT